MINGSSIVTFGGQIGFNYAKDSSVDVPHIILALRELNEKHNIGNHKEHLESKEPQVFLVFDNTKSIDVVIKSLNNAKQILQEEINNMEGENNVGRIL